MYVTKTKVVITTIGGFSATADDAVSAGQGTGAYNALEMKRDVKILAENEITFIPYHAVDHAIITITRSEEEDPVDDTCVESNAEPTPDPEPDPEP